MDKAERKGVAFLRLLASADFFRDAAICLGLLWVNTPVSKSSASLRRVASPDHRRGVFLRFFRAMKHLRQRAGAAHQRFPFAHPERAGSPTLSQAKKTPAILSITENPGVARVLTSRVLGMGGGGTGPLSRLRRKPSGSRKVPNHAAFFQIMIAWVPDPGTIAWAPDPGTCRVAAGAHAGTITLQSALGDSELPIAFAKLLRQATGFTTMHT
jgi:hypothetical protein